ncbi:BMP family ABC transporter substrate-binding protein [Naasia sp. SYSU D00057]|uniref:BMP family ABC transporter substrate-binding protein n=1 Tax=Naasia sp. SYSU D00057 TaxID=2817380 RepID=UPI001B30B64A|nr:BMP family ABC transporter substrate-binding protein [Naasia sp. SYSU D00057]
MTSFARRAGAAAIAVGLVATVAGCSGSDSGGGAGDSASGGDTEASIILITPTPIGSNNFLQLAAEGAEQAGEEYNASVDVYESEDPASIQQNLDAAIREQPDVIVGVSFSVLDQFTEAAANYPDQQFLLIDTTPEEPADNLTSAAFKEYEATYLTGVEAGLLTETNSVGVVASLDTPFLHRWIDPFFEGAKSVNEGVTTAVQYVGGDNPFGDQARAKAQALILGQSGADYIQAAASGGNIGAFEAAAEGGFKAFGVDTNQCEDSPGNVVDNAIKRVDVALLNSVGDILDGKTGGTTAYGLAEGGVGLTGLEEGVEDSQCLIADFPDVIEQVKAVRDQIVSGELEVQDPLTAG